MGLKIFRFSSQYPQIYSGLGSSFIILFQRDTHHVPIRHKQGLQQSAQYKKNSSGTRSHYLINKICILFIPQNSPQNDPFSGHYIKYFQLVVCIRINCLVCIASYFMVTKIAQSTYPVFRSIWQKNFSSRFALALIFARNNVCCVYHHVTQGAPFHYF